MWLVEQKVYPYFITVVERKVDSCQVLTGCTVCCVTTLRLTYLLPQTGAEESLHLISFFINTFHQTLPSSNMLSQWVQSSDWYTEFFTLCCNGADMQSLQFVYLLKGYIIMLIYILRRGEESRQSSAHVQRMLSNYPDKINVIICATAAHLTALVLFSLSTHLAMWTPATPFPKSHLYMSQRNDPNVVPLCLFTDMTPSQLSSVSWCMSTL